jgi:hypothetical protein
VFSKPEVIRDSSVLSRRLKDMTGKRIGRLVVIEFAGFYEHPKHGNRAATCKCRCLCSNELVVSAIRCAPTIPCLAAARASMKTGALEEMPEAGRVAVETVSRETLAKLFFGESPLEHQRWEASGGTTKTLATRLLLSLLGHVDNSTKGHFFPFAEMRTL